MVKGGTMKAGEAGGPLRCVKCDVRLVARRATQERPYRYAISGLPNMGLVGIVVQTCSACGYEQPVFERMSELHQVISMELVKKLEPLTGDELRFMRKQAGFPQGNFAALLGCSQEHLCRVEKNQKPLSDTAERLARAIVAVVARQGDEVREILLAVGNKLERKGRAGCAVLPFFRLKDSHWRPMPMKMAS